MSDAMELLVLSLLAGLAIPVGRLLAKVEADPPALVGGRGPPLDFRLRWGALLSALALVLVPDGIRHRSIPTAALAFSGGAVLFCWFDRWLAPYGGPKAQLAAMPLDFAPEAIALGAVAGNHPSRAPLLAFLIGPQNVPEARNAFGERTVAGRIGARTPSASCGPAGFLHHGAVPRESECAR